MHSRPSYLPIFLLIAACFGLTHPVQATYVIRGKLNLSKDWQRQIFLSTINKLDDYYSANPEDIIQVGHINENGSFAISGNNLPPEQRYYRLYLVKEENSEFDACLYVGGDDHNFVHLILDNNSLIEIETPVGQRAPFGQYSIKGDESNLRLRELSQLVYPSFYFHKIKFPSELQFSQEKLNRDLFEFTDSCRQSLVALAAIMNTDMDKYHQIEAERYNALGERLRSDLPEHSYTQDYYRKLNYYEGHLGESSSPTGLYILIGVLSCVLLLAFAKIKQLQKQLKNLKETERERPAIREKPPVFRPAFTPQEEKILSLIMEGKTNKEIAAALFVELSTVKTHINKLYAKLGVRTRTEARRKTQELNLLNL